MNKLQIGGIKGDLKVPKFKYTIEPLGIPILATSNFIKVLAISLLEP